MGDVVALQRQVAEETIAGHGVLVEEYFDVCSRRSSWWERPAASSLLDATTDPNRPFDAVMALTEISHAY